MTAAPDELPATIYQQVEQLSERGNALADEGQYREAAEQFVAALELLPEPKTNWEACTWLLASIGDMTFQLKAYEQAVNALSDAMHCPDAIGNPFIHLRLGQALFELGDRQRAADELARVYMLEGKDIFAAEDPKYFEFLKTVMKPPAGGTW